MVPSRSLEAHVDVPPEVQTVLKRSCYDCHSSATVWPWYSYVAPVSWYVAHDVNTARGHVNFQNWEAQINEQEGKEHLGLICKLIREGKMPPADYRVMHKGTDISPAGNKCGLRLVPESRHDGRLVRSPTSESAMIWNLARIRVSPAKCRAAQSPAIQKAEPRFDNWKIRSWRRWDKRPQPRNGICRFGFSARADQEAFRRSGVA